jgi:hypothetical protein
MIGVFCMFSGLSHRDALSAPPYPLKSLLERAEHVFIVRPSSRTNTNATFEITEVLRGNHLKSLTLSYSPYGPEFPEHTSGLLLFSQGDDYWGKPESVLRVRQPIKGQASYRGWILENEPGDSTKELERLRELVKTAPYRSNINGPKSIKSPE